MTVYDRAFYQLEGSVALDAGEQVLPWVRDKVAATSVIDVGCGVGAWVRIAHQLRCVAVGVDHNVPYDLRMTDHFIDADLAFGFNCWNYDLAICLEVAEHLPAQTGPFLVHGLTKAKAVLFSAATPGQPGIDHINCRPHDYWHGLFAEDGFTPTHIGPQFPGIADFYQRNMYLYERACS